MFWFTKRYFLGWPFVYLIYGKKGVKYLSYYHESSLGWQVFALFWLFVIWVGVSGIILDSNEPLELWCVAAFAYFPLILTVWTIIGRKFAKKWEQEEQ